jgi:membrane protease YdiL (CAAX protease family)
MSDLSLPEPVRRDQVLDVQHDTDPARDHGVARRIPHLGHALLFIALTVICVVAAVIVLMVIYRPSTLNPRSTELIYISGAGTVIGYAIALAISFPLFPLLWQRSFLDGIDWTFRAVRLHWWKLILLGFGLSLLTQLSDRWLFKTPHETDMAQFFHSPLAAWLTTLFGPLFVPVYEEIAFRGFLLPAFATAYDWLSMPRTPAAVQRWQQTTGHTRAALIFSSCITSVLFVAMHGMQLHWAMGTLGVLLIPSLVFCWVRIKTSSVAAAALVHIAYDSLIFLEILYQTGCFRHLERLSS